MGLFLRCNLFYNVDHQQVYDALTYFWDGEHHRLVPADPQAEDAYVLHVRLNGWTALSWTSVPIALYVLAAAGGLAVRRREQ